MFDWSIDGMCQTLLKLYILDTRIDQSPPPLDPQVTALGIIIIGNVDVRPPHIFSFICCGFISLFSLLCFL